MKVSSARSVHDIELRQILNRTACNWGLLFLAWAMFAAGCGDASLDRPKSPAASPAASRTTAAPKQSKQNSASQAKRRSPPRRKVLGNATQDSQPAAATDLLAAGLPELPPVSETVAANLRAAGIRSITSKHLTLFTDLPTKESIEELPHIFDRAIPQWCSYFEVDPATVDRWHLTAYLIADKNLFRRLGAIRDELPRFLHGYQKGSEIWCYKQPSDYYQRHLLLHEGTHGFMQHFLRGAGPPWYMEGTAELLATHRWQAGQLKLKSFPRNREETPYWGRIKAIREEIAAGRGRSLEEILRYDSRAHVELEPYAWCWAAATFFDHHSMTQQTFRELRRTAADSSPRFSQEFKKSVGDRWNFLAHPWQVFVDGLTYGYDLDSESFSSIPSVSLGGVPRRFDLNAAGGWQSTGFVVAGGEDYEIKARGRYQIGHEPKIWWCEPNGVTIRYYRGFPLGVVLAAVIDEKAATRPSPLLQPVVIGMGASLKPSHGGVLYLRVNDHPRESGDNRGTVQISIRPGGPAANPN